jgi:hypothetical protein
MDKPTPATGPSPCQTQKTTRTKLKIPRHQDQMISHHCRREDVVPTMGGVGTGTKTKKPTSRVVAPTWVDALNTVKLPGPPPQHLAALPRPADRQHHLSGPPSRHTTARARATSPHDPAAHNPSYTGQTARRP